MHLLTEMEIERLTGYKQKSAQVRWLQSNGVRHYVRADGRPNVPSSALDIPKETRIGPNLKAARRTVSL